MKADVIVKSIIFNRELKRILIVQRCGEDEIGAGTWENAGGNVEYGETPEQAIKREIQEETGIAEINIDKVAYVTLVNAENPYLIIAYFCETLTDIVTLSAEHQAYLWADKSECTEKLPQAIIEDFEKNSVFEYTGL